jgi:hypothetical protein
MTVAARLGTGGWHRVVPLFLPRRRTILCSFASKADTPETLRLLVFVALVTVFAAGHAGDLFREPQRTAQLVVPNLNP